MERIPIEELIKRLEVFSDYNMQVQLNKETTILHVPKFIKSHLMYLKNFPDNKSKKRYLPYYDRLLSLCLILEKKNNSTFP